MPSRYRALKWLIAILLVSLALRVVPALVMGNDVESLPGIDDQRSYHMLAQRLLHGFGFTVPTQWWPLTRPGAPTAHWSYLYTLYLAGVYAAFGIKPLVARLLQVLIVGVVWPVLSYRIGRRVAGETVGLLAAAWSALYGYFAYYSAALMTESFFITAVLWSIDLAWLLAKPSRPRGLWVLFGLSLGIAVLLRQSYLLFVPFLLLWLLVPALRSRQAARAWLNGAAMSMAVLALAILPWTVRNYVAFGRFVLLNTNAGYAFFWANHPIYGTEFRGILPPEVSYQSLVPPELRSLDEAALDSALMKEGLAFVRADPGRYLRLSLSRFRTYFMFWPSAESSLLSNVVRVLSFGLALPFVLYGMVLALPKWRQWSLLYLFVFVYSGIHLLSWALIRYRLPVDAVLLIFAAYALADVAGRLRVFRRQATAQRLTQAS